MMPSGSGEASPTVAPVPATLPAASGPAEAADPVSAAVAGLAQLADRPLDEHPEAYQQVHATLQQALQDIPT